MNTLVLLAVCLVILFCGYVFYGRWLVKQWGVGEGDIPTPAHTMNDGIDYMPAKAPVLMGHHFSSIAGAGPITGPIGAAMFGWLPVTLSAVSSSAGSMTSGRSSLLSVIRGSPSGRSFLRICPREPSSSSLFSRI